VPLDARVEAGRAFDDRHDDLRCLLALDRDYRENVALGTLGVDAVGVVALVERSGEGLDAASAELVEQRRNEVRLMVSRRFDLPRERQIGCSANRHVQLEAVEAAALPRTDGAAVPQLASGSEYRSRSGPCCETNRCPLAKAGISLASIATSP
jgi:hypothetical protein